MKWQREKRASNIKVCGHQSASTSNRRTKKKSIESRARRIPGSRIGRDFVLAVSLARQYSSSSLYSHRVAFLYGVFLFSPTLDISPFIISIIDSYGISRYSLHHFPSWLFSYLFSFLLIEARHTIWWSSMSKRTFFFVFLLPLFVFFPLVRYI